MTLIIIYNNDNTLIMGTESINNDEDEMSLRATQRHVKTDKEKAPIIFEGNSLVGSRIME